MRKLRGPLANLLQALVMLSCLALLFYYYRTGAIVVPGLPRISPPQETASGSVLMPRDEILLDDDDPLLSSDEVLLPEDDSGLMIDEYASSTPLISHTPWIASPEQALPLIASPDRPLSLPAEQAPH